MNGTEQKVRAELERRGFTVLQNGWPDFLCTRPIPYRPTGLGVMAVEVKSALDKLSVNQRTVHKALTAARLPVYVIRSGDEWPEDFKTHHILMPTEKRRVQESAKRITDEIAQLQKQLDALRVAAEGAADQAACATPLLEVSNPDLLPSLRESQGGRAYKRPTAGGAKGGAHCAS
jgi:VRR-NUC domain